MYGDTGSQAVQQPHSMGAALTVQRRNASESSNTSLKVGQRSQLGIAHLLHDALGLLTSLEGPHLSKGALEGAGDCVVEPPGLGQQASQVA